MSFKKIIESFWMVTVTFILLILGLLTVSCQLNQKSGSDESEPLDYYSQVNWDREVIIEGLKEPNTWTNLWNDILIVNKLNPDDFSFSVVDQNLLQIRNFYHLNKEGLINGTLTTTFEEKKFQKSVPIYREILNNYQDVDFTFKNSVEFAESYSPVIEWTIPLETDLNFWQNLVIQFTDDSANQNSVYLNFDGKNTAYLLNQFHRISKTTQNINISAKSAISYITSLLLGYSLSTGIITFKINWNSQQLINLVNNAGQKLRINLGWSFWAIAIKSGKNYFGIDHNDLFTLDNWNFNSKTADFTFNIPIQWKNHLEILGETANILEIPLEDNPNGSSNYFYHFESNPLWRQGFIPEGWE